MLKIKDELVGRIFRSDLTGNELNILLSFISKADEAGKVDGIYYKDSVDEVGCCNATFYSCITSLTEKGFIRKRRNGFYSSEWEVEVIGNDFCDKGGFTVE